MKKKIKKAKKQQKIDPITHGAINLEATHFGLAEVKNDTAFFMLLFKDSEGVQYASMFSAPAILDKAIQRDLQNLTPIPLRLQSPIADS